MIAVRSAPGAKRALFALLALLALGSGQTSIAHAQPRRGDAAAEARQAATRQRAIERAADRVLARAEQALVAGRPERALATLEAGARRSPHDGRAAARFCELAVPERDETVSALAAGSERIASDASRCHDLLVLHGEARPERAADVVDRIAWARALIGDRAPALARAASRPLDERDVVSLRRLAVLALHEGSLEDAETALVLARRVRPSDLDLASELGAVRLARGDAPGAVSLFRAVVAGRPGDRDALHDLAGACLQAGETAAALRALESLASAEPQLAVRWLELALARVEVGAYPLASADARRAMELAPDDPRPALVLGDALRLAGDGEGAQAAYEDALRRDPSSIRARRALDSLASAQ